MTCVSASSYLQVVPEKLFVVGMCTLFYDVACTLCGTLSAEVGNTLLGNDDVDVVLRVVLVAYEGNDT